MASVKELFEMVTTYSSLQSVALDVHTLLPREKELFDLIKKGDQKAVQQFLQENEHVDMNTIDYKGQFPLQLAVKNQDEEMVQYLLSVPDIKMRDALLHAIKQGNLRITEMLLNWKKNLTPSPKVEESFESADFPAHIKPMMLACIQNNYDIISVMLHMGYKIEIPSGTNDSGKKKFKENVKKLEKVKKLCGESLEAGKARIDGFTALSSSVYICLTSSDPLLTAFLLAHKADKLAFDDPNFRQEYVTISRKCKQFSVDLLDECRTSEEVELLLRQDHDAAASVMSGGEYPRLRMAMEWQIREFITHKNCQQVMESMWTKANLDVMKMSFWTKLVYFTPQMLILPLVYLAYFLLPFLNFSYWKAPMNKFLGDMVSYFIFLSVLFYDIYSESTSAVYQRIPDYQIVEVVEIVYVVGFAWELFRTTLKQGLRAFQNDWWLAYMAAMILCFTTSGIARIASIIMSAIEGEAYKNEDRIFWSSGDPALVAESFFCLGVILAFARLLYMFQISQILGPIQLSLSLMINDVLQMLFIFFVFIFAFALGLTRLYYFYGGMTRIEAGGEEIQQPDKFISENFQI